MNRLDLLKHLDPAYAPRLGDCPLSALAYDSRKVVPGGAFFAIRGQHSDGHRFVSQAVERGAVLVVSEEPVEVPGSVESLVVSSSRLALARASALFFGEPSRDMLVIGITGTNGKTTVSYLLEAILRAAGRRPAVFGTVDYRFENERHPSSHTTPESLDLMALVADFRAKGADALVLEVSSHALDQYRADGLDFDLAVFTNLTPEHLDYHEDMETYFASKGRLFGPLLGKKGGTRVINADDPYGRRLLSQYPQAWSCGTGDDCRVQVQKQRFGLEGIEARFDTPEGSLDVRSPLVGEYNLSNLLCAVTAALALGISASVAERGLAEAAQVPGRMERVENDLGACILVDYAHTGDALEKALQAVESCGPRRIVTVFGCGGDRDRSKRPVMGEAAARHSRLSILTSDNPRTEDPRRILADVIPGLERICGELEAQEAKRRWERDEEYRAYVVIEDRHEAIDYAVSLLGEGDLLLVAGKGHEDYQVLASGTIHFDDREEVRRALASKEARA